MIVKAKEEALCPPTPTSAVPPAATSSSPSEATGAVPSATESSLTAVKGVQEICPQCQMFPPRHQDACPDRPIEHQEMGMEGL